MKCILLVDSLIDNFITAKKIIKDNYRLLYASTVKDAIDILTKEDSSDIPDLIIIDGIYARESDRKLIKFIRSNSDMKACQIIISTETLNGLSEEESYRLGADDVVSKPFLANSFSKHIERNIETAGYRKNFEKLVMIKTEQIFQMQHKILTTLAKMIEYKDGMTGGHVIRASAYVEIIADELKKNSPYSDIMYADFYEDVIKSAPLHDIGKIGISDTLILKPAILTDEEFDIMRNHTVCGSAIIDEALTDIEGESYLRVAKDMALYHHEKWDGSGYPEGLSKTDIPLCARIMAVADVFDSLVSVRTYKDAYSYEKAFEIIVKEKGKHFDPVIVDAFLKRKADVISVGSEFGNGDIASYNRDTVIRQYLNAINK